MTEQECDNAAKRTRQIEAKDTPKKTIREVFNSFEFIELERVNKMYDVENDIIPNQIRVTHTDKTLIDAVIELANRVDRLEREAEIL